MYLTGVPNTPSRGVLGKMEGGGGGGGGGEQRNVQTSSSTEGEKGEGEGSMDILLQGLNAAQRDIGTKGRV